MRILITGCRGFLGGSVGRFAAEAGHTVLGIGRSSQPEPDWPGSYYQMDVAYSDLARMIKEFAPDALLHAAGTASVQQSFHEPLGDLHATVQSWANVLDSVRRSGRQPHVLFPSSAAVYGNPDRLPVTEDAVARPLSPYGFHKAACELIGREYSECYGLTVTVMRLFSIFGARQRRLLIWELYTQACGRSREIVLQGTGTETRDYMYIEDIADVMLQLAEPRNDGYLVVNVASGVEVQIRRLAEQVSAVVGVDKAVRCLGNTRVGDPAHWQADISLLRRHVTTKPIGFTDRLAECVRAWQCA